jgi:hypothetical protein
MVVTDMGWEDVDRIHVAHDRDKWPAYMIHFVTFQATFLPEDGQK